MSLLYCLLHFCPPALSPALESHLRYLATTDTTSKFCPKKSTQKRDTCIKRRKGSQIHVHVCHVWKINFWISPSANRTGLTTLNKFPPHGRNLGQVPKEKLYIGPTSITCTGKEHQYLQFSPQNGILSLDIYGKQQLQFSIWKLWDYILQRKPLVPPLRTFLPVSVTFTSVRTCTHGPGCTWAKS